jgi:amino acid transporter
VTVVALTAVNAAGVQQGKWTQNILTLAIVLGLLLVMGAGLMHLGTPAPEPSAPAPSGGGGSAWGMAMIFVLLTYGGWNEAAYLSAELRDKKGSRRAMVRVLLGGICLITLIYLAVNLAFLRGLGLEGMAKSQAVASDLMRQAMGDYGAAFISLLIAIAALSTMNATIITGARSTYALGADYPIFGFLGRWREEASTPANAIWLQGLIALGLVGFGAFARSGFATMVEYTAPVFWFFFLLGGLSLFILRRKDPGTERPFRVPLYPVTPILFCLVCAYMLHSSLMYTGKGALIGVAVLLLGLPVLWVARRGRDTSATNHPNP